MNNRRESPSSLVPPFKNRNPPTRSLVPLLLASFLAVGFAASIIAQPLTTTKDDLRLKSLLEERKQLEDENRMLHRKLKELTEKLNTLPDTNAGEPIAKPEITEDHP